MYTANKDNKNIDKLLLSKNTKDALRESLSPPMSRESLNNHLLQLRAKWVISEKTISSLIKTHLPGSNNAQVKIEYRIDVGD